MDILRSKGAPDATNIAPTTSHGQPFMPYYQVPPQNVAGSTGSPSVQRAQVNHPTQIPPSNAYTPQRGSRPQEILQRPAASHAKQQPTQTKPPPPVPQNRPYPVEKTSRPGQQILGTVPLSTQKRPPHPIPAPAPPQPRRAEPLISEIVSESIRQQDLRAADASHYAQKPRSQNDDQFRRRGSASRFRPRKSIPQIDYDFDEANAKFNKVEINDDSERKQIQNGVNDVAESAYNPSKSFFDNISCENSDHGNAEKAKKAEWRSQERSLNMETFGQTRVGRYRGRGRGRGRGRYPRDQRIRGEGDRAAADRN